MFAWILNKFVFLLVIYMTEQEWEEWVINIIVIFVVPFLGV